MREKMFGAAGRCLRPAGTVTVQIEWPIKDEYEWPGSTVMAAFKRQLGKQFQSYDKLEYQYAPPVLAGRRKRASGKIFIRPGNGGAFPVLSALKVLPRTPFGSVRLQCGTA